MTADSLVIGRKMFLSYVKHMTAGPYVFDAKPRDIAPTDIPVQPMEKANGYLIHDNHMLLLRGEHVYFEIDWEQLKKDLKDT